MGSLQLQYNRGRQAVITNELIDIITVRHSFSSHHKRFIANDCQFFFFHLNRVPLLFKQVCSDNVIRGWVEYKMIAFSGMQK